MFGRTTERLRDGLEDWPWGARGGRPCPTAAIWSGPLGLARLTPQSRAILKNMRWGPHVRGGRSGARCPAGRHGLDTHDNDFVIGLVGRDLHPLSHLVQTMRRTAQTSEFIQTLGPFFIGGSVGEEGQSNLYFAIGRFF
jgi:hypothetical protein